MQPPLKAGSLPKWKNRVQAKQEQLEQPDNFYVQANSWRKEQEQAISWPQR